MTTRGKPPSSSSNGTTGIVKPSVLVDPAAQNKRKREALGEVTGKSINNRTKPALDPKGKGKEGTPVREFRGVPEDVQLFEVFWQQVVQLIRVSTDEA